MHDARTITVTTGLAMLLVACAIVAAGVGPYRIAPLTPRSRTRRTASILNSLLNLRLCIANLRLHETPYLGVHETGSRPMQMVLPGL